MISGLGFQTPSMRAIAWTLLVGMLLASAMAMGAPLDGEAQAAYQAAHAAMTSGQAREGAVQLIELLRAVPDDDAAMADAFIGPSQLLGFAVASLLNWPQRTALLAEVLEPETYPTDALLIAAMKAGSGAQSTALPAQLDLRKLAGGDHVGVRAAALYILGEPYYYPGSKLQAPAVAELVLNFPNLEFTRCIVEMPVYHALEEALKAGVSQKNLLESVAYWGGQREMVLQASPGLARAAEALPSLDIQDFSTGTVTQWANSLRDEEDGRSRYTIVSLLAKSCSTADRRNAARAGLEAVAARPPATPDVVRARILLAEFARQDHDPGELERHVLGLLHLGVLPCTAERSMYEAVMHAAQHAARYYTRMGAHAQALRIHDALAAKFPDTTLAAEALAKAAAIRDNALQATLDLVALEMNAPLRNGDLATARQRYQAIIANTRHEALQGILTDKLHEIEAESARLQAEMRTWTGEIGE